MSDLNKMLRASVKTAVESAEVHKETGAVVFKAPEFPKGITPASLKDHVDFINQTSVVTGAALSEIALDNYPESKMEKWTGELDLVDGLTISSGYQVREVVGDDTAYGVSEVFVDYDYGQALSDWHTEFAQVNADRAADLFK